jgi:hypothetical protein
MPKSTPKNTTTRKNYGITRPKRGGKKSVKRRIKNNTLRRKNKVRTMRGGNVRTILHNGETITIPVEMDEPENLNATWEVYREIITEILNDNRITNEVKREKLEHIKSELDAIRDEILAPGHAALENRRQINDEFTTFISLNIDLPLVKAPFADAAASA